jgi:hypothetical protein
VNTGVVGVPGPPSPPPPPVCRVNEPTNALLVCVFIPPLEAGALLENHQFVNPLTHPLPAPTPASPTLDRAAL